MVTLTEAGMIGGFSYSAWNILGKWYRGEDKAQTQIYDAWLLSTMDADKKPSDSQFPFTAMNTSGQGHVLADWQRLPMPLKCQLMKELAELVFWLHQPSQYGKDISGTTWDEMVAMDKIHAMTTVDRFPLDIRSLIGPASSNLCGTFLWEPTDSLPLLHFEPTSAIRPAAKLVTLLERYEKAATAVKTVLDSQRLAQVDGLKEVVQPLDVAKAMRNLQVLKSLVQSMGVDTTKTPASCGAELRALLAALVLEPSSTEMSADVEAALKSLDAAAESEVEAERSVKMPLVEDAARSAYVIHLTKAAQADEIWKPDSDLLPKVMFVESLFSELASSMAGEPGTEELSQAVNCILPKLCELIDIEVPEELSTGLSSSQPAMAATQLASAMAAAALPQLLAEAEDKAALAALNKTGEEIVKSLVAGILTNITGDESYVKNAEPPVATAADIQNERNRMRKVVEEAASDASAAVQQAGMAALETALAGLKVEATVRAKEAMAGRVEELNAAEKVAHLTTLVKDLLTITDDAKFFDGFAEIIDIINILDNGSLAAESEAALTQTSRAYSMCTLAATVKSMDMGPGVTSTLARIDAYFKEVAADIEAKAVAEQAGEGEDGGDGGDGDADESIKAAEERLKMGNDLIQGLLQEGVVLSELQTSALHKLRSLREIVDALKPSMDAAVWNRSVTSLKDLVGQLGPIGAAVDQRLSQMGDDEESSREVLKKLRGDAIAIYHALQKFIETDTVTRPVVLKDLTSIKEMVCSIKVKEKKSSSLETSIALLTSINEKAVSITQAIQPMPGSEEAISVVYVMEEQVEVLEKLLPSLLQIQRLREAALKPSPPLPLPDVNVELESAWVELFDARTADQEMMDACRTAGYKLMSRGQAAVLLMVNGVEGGDVRVTTDIGLPSTKSLLQLFGERLFKVQKLSVEAMHGVGSEVTHPLPWLIMATPETVGPVNDFLKEGHYFGLDPRQVHVFSNNTRFPIYNEDLKVVMESPYKIASSKGGSGEIFQVLHHNGMLDLLSRSGVKHLNVHTLEDNILAKPADPVFIGYHVVSEGVCSAKILDSLDLAATYNGYASVMAPPSGEVSARLGSPFINNIPCTGQYCLSLSWMKQIVNKMKGLPLMLLRLEPAGDIPSKGAKVSGYKLDRRLSDFVALWAHRTSYMMVDPAQEFSLVWGSSPFYTPETSSSAVEDLLLLHTGWVEQAGGTVLDGSAGEGDASDAAAEAAKGNNVVEVSPLVSYEGEGLEVLVEDREFQEAYDLDLQGFAATAGRKNNMGPWIVPFGIAYIGLAALKLISKAKK